MDMYQLLPAFIKVPSFYIFKSYILKIRFARRGGAPGSDDRWDDILACWRLASSL